MRVYFVGSNILMTIEAKKLLICSFWFLNFLSHAILAFIRIGGWLDVAIEGGLVRPRYFVDDRFFDFLVGQSVDVLVLHNIIISFERRLYKWSRIIRLLDSDEFVDSTCCYGLDGIALNSYIFFSTFLPAGYIFSVGNFIEHLHEGGIDGVGLNIIIDEVEIGGVGHDIVLPDGLDGLDQRMVDLDFMFIEDVNSLHDDVEEVVLPPLLEPGEFRDLANALVDQMLDLAVDVDVELQLVVNEKDQNFQHVPAFRFLQDEKDNLVDRLGDFVFVFDAIVIKVDQEVHEHPGQILQAVRIF